MKPKVIALTGATGYLGQALIPFLLKEYKPKVIRLLGRSEFKLAQIIRGQGYKYDLTQFRPLICDVRDRERVFSCLKGADLVLATAALKRLEIISYNSQEALKTNVYGMQNIMDACLNLNVKKLVFTSSDKAYRSVNLYGATKFVSEQMIINRGQFIPDGPPIMTITRYGNLLFSTGGFTEFMINRLKRNEPIPLTHEGMSRFIMTKRMALNTVKKAIESRVQGSIHLPDELYAIKVKRSIEILKKYYKSNSEIKIIGCYIGEKLAEELDDGIVSDNPTYQVSDEKYLELLSEDYRL